MAARKQIVLTPEQQQIVVDNMKLAYWGAKKIRNKEVTAYLRMDYDDCLSLCMEALCRAAAWYDPAKGKYSTAFAMIMERLLCRRYEESQCNRNRGIMDMVSLDDAYYNVKFDSDEKDQCALIDRFIGKEPDVLESVMQSCEAERIIRALKVQPPDDIAIFLSYVVEGKKGKEIAQEFGVSHTTIMTRIKATSERIRLRIISEDILSTHKMKKERKNHEHLHDYGKPHEST